MFEKSAPKTPGQNFDSVKGKVAIVTGASRGIGEAIARVYGEDVMIVVLAARSADLRQLHGADPAGRRDHFHGENSRF